MAFLLTLPSNPTLSYSCLSSFSSAADDLSFSLSSLSFRRSNSPQILTIRMGGGPRTYPGGVNKWQWKRMQKKKAKQLLKARLMRERQIYEMRKRAELKAAVSELERPWEVVEQVAPNLFSVGADEQLKVLADRFQKPGGFDLWTEKDGPQLFETPDGLPTSRFFPKGVVHSIKPYGRFDFDEGLGAIEDKIDDREEQTLNSDPLNSRVSSRQRNLDRKGIGSQRDRSRTERLRETEGSHDRVESEQRNLAKTGSGNRRDVKSRFSDNSRVFRSDDRAEREQMNLAKNGSGNRRDVDLRKIGNSRSENGAIILPNWRRSASSSSERRNSSGGQIDRSRMEKMRNSSSEEELYDLSLQRDGSYSLGSIAEKHFHTDLGL